MNETLADEQELDRAIERFISEYRRSGHTFDEAMVQLRASIDRARQHDVKMRRDSFAVIKGE